MSGSFRPGESKASSKRRSPWKRGLQGGGHRALAPCVGGRGREEVVGSLGAVAVLILRLL